MAENMRDMTLNLIVNSQVNKVKEFNKNLKDTENSITRTTNKAGWLSKTLGRVFGVYFGIQGVKNIVNTYRKLDLVRQSLNGLAGGAEAGARQFEYLRREAFRTATDFTTIATKYRNFYAAAKGAGFDEQQTQSMFSGLLTAGRALGADKSSIGGALLAVEQMLSKGRVSMEELRRQLGNAYAGAIQVAARAMGVVPEEFEKLLKKGLSSKEFVPKLTAQFEKEFKDSLKEAVKSLDAEMVRLGNAWQIMVLKFGDSGAGKQFAKVIRQITMILSSPKVILAVETFGKALNVVLDILTYLISNIKIIAYFLAPFMLGAALTRTISLIKEIVLWIGATNSGLATTQKFLLRLFVLLAGIKTIRQELKGEGLLSEIITGKTKEGKEIGIGGRATRATAVIGGLDLLITALTKGKVKMPISRWLWGKTGGKLVPKTWSLANIMKWAKGGEQASEIAKEAKAIETIRESLILNKQGLPFKLAPKAPEVANVAKVSTTASKFGWAKNLIPFASAGIMATLFDYLLLADLMHTGNKNVAKMGVNPMTINPYGFAQPFNTKQMQQWGFAKTETNAPTINYNPQYNIDARGMSPEQLQQVLQKHDENFWSGFIQRTKGGFGYLKHLFGSTPTTP